MQGIVSSIGDLAVKAAEDRLNTAITNLQNQINQIVAGGVKVVKTSIPVASWTTDGTSWVATVQKSAIKELDDSNTDWALNSGDVFLIQPNGTTEAILQNFANISVAEIATVSDAQVLKFYDREGAKPTDVIDIRIVVINPTLDT